MPVSSVRFRRTILVTGFGAFPGAPRNPTAVIIEDLKRHRARFARLGIDLRCETLPVLFDNVGTRLEALIKRHSPDAILHLGLAGRRQRISVETRALNRANPLHPDAGGHRPASVLLPGGPAILRATYPAERILADLRRHGFDATRSNDTGDYVCNATLYQSLICAGVVEVGFLHVPRPRRRGLPIARLDSRRHTLEGLSRAVLVAVLAMARPRCGR